MNLQYFMMKKKKTKAKNKTGNFNRFMNGHIQLVLSWWAGLLPSACKQLAFLLQLSLWYSFALRQKYFCTREPLSATYFLLIFCPSVRRQKRRGKEHASPPFLIIVDDSIIYYILGLTWDEVLTVECIYLYIYMFSTEVRMRFWACVVGRVDDRPLRENKSSSCPDRCCVIIFAEQQNPTEQSE